MAIDCEIDYRHVDQGQPLQGRARNISGNGMLFVSEQEISVGSLLEIQVKPGNPSIPALDAVVEVVRINSRGEQALASNESSNNYEVGAVIVSMK